MLRTIQPERLDSLAPDDPAARRFRRDMRLTNRIMGNHRWIARVLPPLLRPGETVLELGAGTGELAARLARRGPPVDGLDLWPVPAGWPAERRWHRADLLRFDGYAAYPVFAGNMILHQFDDPALGQLGETLRRSARVIVACEPARRRASQVLYRLFAPLVGANHVSRHDGEVSIAAGFLGDELPRVLGLAAPEWAVRCSTTLLGAYHLVAVRRA